MERQLVVGGLIVAVVGGIGGSAVSGADAELALFAASSLGWVVATGLLTLRHAQRNELVVATGFLILTVAETLLWTNGRIDSPGYADGFAGGAIFYVPGLLLLAAPLVYNWVVRVLAAAAGGVWAAAVIPYFTGSELTHDSTISGIGYAALSATFLGVAWVVLRTTTE
jgi:hypothetical protein